MDSDSPCIKICVIDPACGLCSGCQRTLAEIAAWPRLDTRDRRRIMAELGQRRTRANSGG